tara:strand:+ start:7548 stop:8708 length:1161 start_codon:yes stop_codon:yes gene_type:complete
MAANLVAGYVDGGYSAYSFRHLARNCQHRSAAEMSMTIVATTIVPLVCVAWIAAELLNIHPLWVVLCLAGAVLDKFNLINRHVLVLKRKFLISFFLDSTQALIFFLLLICVFLFRGFAQPEIGTVIYAYITSFFFANILGMLLSNSASDWGWASIRIFRNVLTGNMGLGKPLRMMRKTILVSVETNTMALWWGAALLAADYTGGRSAVGLFGVLQRFLGLSRTLTAFTLVLRKRAHYLTIGSQGPVIKQTLVEACVLAVSAFALGWCWNTFGAEVVEILSFSLTGFAAVVAEISKFSLQIGCIMGAEYAYYHLSQMVLGRNLLAQRILPPLVGASSLMLTALFFKYILVDWGTGQILGIYGITLVFGVLYLMRILWLGNAKKILER